MRLVPVGMRGRGALLDFGRGLELRFLLTREVLEALDPCLDLGGWGRLASQGFAGEDSRDALAVGLNEEDGSKSSDSAPASEE